MKVRGWHGVLRPTDYWFARVAACWETGDEMDIAGVQKVLESSGFSTLAGDAESIGVYYTEALVAIVVVSGGKVEVIRPRIGWDKMIAAFRDADIETVEA